MSNFTLRFPEFSELQEILSQRHPQKILHYQCLFFAIIAIFNLLIYFPSFLHVARADQIAYLLRMADTHDWFSLAIKSYAYNRSGAFASGDELLFRPVFYFLLGTEKWMFGYNFVCWQIAGVLLHLGVIWWLLRLLLDIQLSIFAPLLVLFFSVSYIGMEMVIWHHINGYMLFVMFVLAALYQFRLYVSEERPQPWRLWVITGYLSVASFTYEVGCILSLLFTVYLWMCCREGVVARYAVLSLSHSERGQTQGVEVYKSIPLQQRSALILLLPCILYVTLNATDLYFKGFFGRTVAASDIANRLSVEKTAKQVIIADVWWFYGGVFATQVKPIASGRVEINPPDLCWREFTRTRNLLSLSVISGFALISVYLLILSRAMSIKFIKERLAFIALITLIIISYTMLIVVGRANVVGLERGLTNNLYYSYIFEVFCIVLIYSAVPFENLGNTVKLKSIAIGLLLTLSFLNGLLVQDMNWKMVEWSKPYLQLVRKVESLLNKHREEPDFSFWVDSSIPGNPTIDWLKKGGDPQDKCYTFIETLYPRYVKEANPQYVYIPSKKAFRKANAFPR